MAGSPGPLVVAGGQDDWPLLRGTGRTGGGVTDLLYLVTYPQIRENGKNEKRRWGVLTEVEPESRSGLGVGRADSFFVAGGLAP